MNTNSHLDQGPLIVLMQLSKNSGLVPKMIMAPTEAKPGS
jgi:hypothetical protein